MFAAIAVLFIIGDALQDLKNAGVEGTYRNEDIKYEVTISIDLRTHILTQKWKDSAGSKWDGYSYTLTNPPTERILSYGGNFDHDQRLTSYSNNIDRAVLEGTTVYTEMKTIGMSIPVADEPLGRTEEDWQRRKEIEFNLGNQTMTDFTGERSLRYKKVN